MAKKNVKTLAAQAVKLQGRIEKAAAAIEGRAHWLEYQRGEYAKLPAEIQTTRAELQAARDMEAQTLAELNKPLELYHYEARYYGRNHSGPRRYGSKAAQAAWNACTLAERTAERLQEMETNAAKTTEEYTAEARAELEAAQADLLNLQALHNATVERIKWILKDDASDLVKLSQAAPTEETPPSDYYMLARETPSGYRLTADRLAVLKGKFVAFAGRVFSAPHIREWARLEGTAPLDFSYDQTAAVIRLQSPTARAEFKAAGETRPAPALVFAS